MTPKTLLTAAGVVLAGVATLWLVHQPVSTDRAGAGAIALGDLIRDFGIVPVTGAAKPFSLESLDGRRVTLADLKGRPVVLYFWASW